MAQKSALDCANEFVKKNEAWYLLVDKMPNGEGKTVLIQTLNNDMANYIEKCQRLGSSAAAKVSLDPSILRSGVLPAQDDNLLYTPCLTKNCRERNCQEAEKFRKQLNDLNNYISINGSSKNSREQRRELTEDLNRAEYKCANSDALITSRPMSDLGRTKNLRGTATTNQSVTQTNPNILRVEGSVSKGAVTIYYKNGNIVTYTFNRLGQQTGEFHKKA